MSTGIWGKKKLKKELYKKIQRKTMSGIMETKTKDLRRREWSAMSNSAEVE